jgi:TRAP-type C4-dicarboxylate transport system substrate-binding protein
MSLNKVQRPARGRLAAVAAVSALALLVAGCASDTGASGESNAGGQSIEYGAEKSAYVEALADMDPVEFVIQSTGPKDSATGRRFEDYAKAVEEWSDSKITFEFIYSNGAAGPTEVHEAIADGRIDIGSVMPSLIPSEFPVANAFWDLSHLGRQTPVDSMLQWHGIMFELTTVTDRVDAEYEDHGMKLLLPAFGSGAYMPYCKDDATTLDAMKGKGIASQSRIQNAQTEALGLKPSSIAYTEMYESLQRGVVDCALSTVTGAALGGYIDAAPHVAFNPEVGFNSPGGSIAISLDRWNELPLAAQQLMIDRLDALMQANFEGAWENANAAVEQVLAADGEFGEFDEAATAALREANEAAEADIAAGDAFGDGEEFLALAKEAESRWATTVAGLDIRGLDTAYEDFPAWYAEGVPDLQPYFDILWQDVVEKRRPS